MNRVFYIVIHSVEVQVLYVFEEEEEEKIHFNLHIARPLIMPHLNNEKCPLIFLLNVLYDVC